MLPPVQTYYLLTACSGAQGGCEYSLADFAPPLLTSQDRVRVISSEEFFATRLPALAERGLLGDFADWPPKRKVLRAAVRCTPRHKAADSCFPLYDWLDTNFLAPFVPDTEGTVVFFGRAEATAARGADWTEARVAKARYDPPEMQF